MPTRDVNASIAARKRVLAETLERAREEGREEVRALVRAFIEEYAFRAYGSGNNRIESDGLLAALEDPEPWLARSR